MMSSSAAPPKPNETCPFCKKTFEYDVNPDWVPTTFKALSDKTYWKERRHMACERKIVDEASENRVKHASEEKSVRAKRLLREYGFPRILDEKTFANFMVSPPTRAAHQALSNWSYNKTGILLYGTPGTGKSHLMAALAHKWSEAGLIVSFQNVPTLLDTFRRGFDDESYHARVALISSDHVNILILDDLGAEKPSEWAEEQLYRVIDSRLTAGIPIFATTNCSEESLRQKFHPRIISRLKETCDWIEVTGNDWRAWSAEQRKKKRI